METTPNTIPLGWEDSAISRLVALQVQGPEFDPYTHISKKVYMVVSLVTPALGRKRWVGPWVSLASQPDLMGKFQATESPCLNNNNNNETNKTLPTTLTMNQTKTVKNSNHT